jgi:hypothetical protein
VKLSIIKTGLLIIALGASAYGCADIVIVGCADVPAVSLKEVRQIFLKRSSAFPDGTSAIPIDLSDNQSIKWQFYQKVVGKERSQVYSYWARASVSNKKATQPEQVQTIADLKKQLKKQGSIGYMDAKYVESGMNVLLRIPSDTISVASN